MSHIAQSLANCFTVKSFDIEKFLLLDKIKTIGNRHRQQINELDITETISNKPDLETVSSLYIEMFEKVRNAKPFLSPRKLKNKRLAASPVLENTIPIFDEIV